MFMQYNQSNYDNNKSWKFYIDQIKTDTGILHILDDLSINGSVNTINISGNLSVINDNIHFNIEDNYISNITPYYEITHSSSTSNNISNSGIKLKVTNDTNDYWNIAKEESGASNLIFSSNGSKMVEFKNNGDVSINNNLHVNNSIDSSNINVTNINNTSSNNITISGNILVNDPSINNLLTYVKNLEKTIQYILTQENITPPDWWPL
tara:strand:+ start:3941 stop:4564 length:624 start_codon:yes stop_codon:yes gene_type:complete